LGIQSMKRQDTLRKIPDPFALHTIWAIKSCMHLKTYTGGEPPRTLSLYTAFCAICQ
jgi:hypothetical protein